jgi:quercetin dioxygenase-like cupin family protein
MFMCRNTNRILILALGAFVAGNAGVLLRAQAPGPSVRALIREPLGDLADPKVTVLTLTVGPAMVIGPHSHAGPVFAYILEGEIENQVDPDQPKTFKAGDFFYEPAMHVHRVLRNLSQTAPATLVIFQLGSTGKPSPAVKTLLQEALTVPPDPEMSWITLTLGPGVVSQPHKHGGPVFAYILQGEIENQVDPDQPKSYRAGDVFYEPAMHVHRVLRNLSKNEPTKLLILQVNQKGQPSTLAAE